MLNLLKKYTQYKVFTIVLAFSISISFLYACTNTETGSTSSANSSKQSSEEIKPKTGLSDKRIAVVYFSAFDNLEEAANAVADKVKGDVIKLEPLVPYTEDDFIEGNENSRILLESRYNPFEEETEELIEEHALSYGIEKKETIASEAPAKATELPAIRKINVDRYDVIFIGYPIWYNDAPKVVYSFLKDLKNKVVIPFTTSYNGEKITASEEIINNFVDESVEIIYGLELSGKATESEISNWLTLININV